MTARENAIQIFTAAVAAVQPCKLMSSHLYIHDGQLHILDHHFSMDSLPAIYVVGAGKASAAMAVALEHILVNFITAGIIVTKYNHSLPLQKVTCREAAHPVPDERGVAASAETVQLLQQCQPHDIVICLISGGASSLWIDLPGKASMAEVQDCYGLLLASGATIDEVNTVRRHLSAIKGGQLLTYAPQANWFSFIISDVPGDDLQASASGPTVPDNTTFLAVKNILAKYLLIDRFPASIMRHINNGLNGLVRETLKPGDEVFKRVHNKIIGNNRLALAAAATKARELGYHVAMMNGNLAGSADKAGYDLVNEALKYDGKLPACFILGGETTVTIIGQGKGGRNQQMALAALIALDAEKETVLPIKLTFLSAGTDGTDGPTDAAGAMADEEILKLAKEKNLDIKNYLFNNDAYHFFEQTGGLLKTGATQTNVMDLVVVIIEQKNDGDYLL
ncbi:MAG: DUF4147 domain-containing protein [Ferruginibacter sp.]